MSEYPRRRATKQPERVGSLNTLADVLPGLYKDLKMDLKINEFALLALWPTVLTAEMGPTAEIACEHTKAIKIRRQGNKITLLVKVAHAVLASELTFHTMPLLSALNAYTPQTGLKVDQIQWMVGSLS